MKIKLLITFLFFVSSSLFVAFKFNSQKQETILQAKKLSMVVEDKKENTEEVNPVAKSENQDIKEKEYIKQQVPFVVQAPFGNWKDSVFQNSCEEASIVMAIGWVRGVDNVSAEEANKQILEIVKFEDKVFGYNEDANLADVEKIFKQHFKHERIEIKKNITILDLRDELSKGNIIIAPAFGRELKNPNFTSPGPVAHMLVIIGYDSKNNRFITNDPGTKHGKDYLYDEKVLFDAIWQYPNGPGPIDPPQKNKKEKSVIVISKWT